MYKTYLAALVVALTAAVSAQASVTVNGSGQIIVKPDVAHVSVGVNTNGKTAASASEANNAAMKALFDRLKQLGLSDRDVQSISYHVGPLYRTLKDGTRELIGYEVRHLLRVTVQKIDDTGKVVDELVQAGANDVQNVTFAVKDNEKLMDEARRKAVADARRKAELYAAAAGAQLGKVVSISELGAYAPVFRSFAREEMIPGVPFATGEQPVSVNVTVVFELQELPPVGCMPPPVS